MVKFSVPQKAIYLIIPVLVFLFTLYFFASVDTSLIYYSQQPFFVPGDFGQSLLGLHGNLAKWLGDFFTMLLEYESLGRIVLGVVLFSVAGLLYRMLSKNNAPETVLFLLSLWLLPFVSAIANYSFPLHIMLSHVLAVVIAFLLVLLTAKMPKAWYAIIIPGAILVYFGTAAAGLFTFIAICSGLATIEKKYLRAGIILLSGIIIPYLLFTAGYGITLKQAYLENYLIPKHFEIPKYIKHVPYYTFGVFLLIPIGNLLKPVFGKQLRSLLIILLLLCIPFGYMMFKAPDREAQRLLTINKYADQQNWEKLLDVANEAVCSDIIAQANINRALYHRGILLDRIYHYPQMFGKDGLLVDRFKIGYYAMTASDIYYELGFLNESRHWANEAFTVFGKQPRILTRLAQTAIAAEKQELAKKFLSVLKTSPQTKKWAREMETCLNQGTCFENYYDYRNLQQNKPQKDFFTVTNTNIFRITKNNPQNRMAFEYYIAQNMMVHHLGSVVKNLDRFRELGYQKLPRAVQETILLFSVNSDEKNFSLYGYSIDPDVQRDFVELTKILQSYNANIAAAKKSLSKFKDTYWYYVFYNSPVTNKSSIKTKIIDEEFY